MSEKPAWGGPKRALVAVALSLSFGFLLSPGFVSAVDGLDNPVVYSFRFPMVGDQGRYEARMADARGPVLDRALPTFAHMEFEWLPVTRRATSAGPADEVAVVHLSTPGPYVARVLTTDRQIVHLVDAARLVSVEAAVPYLQFDRPIDLNTLHPHEAYPGDWMFHVDPSRDDARTDALCDLLLPLVGLEVREHLTEVPLTNGCKRTSNLLASPTARLVPVNVTEGAARVMVWEQWEPGGTAPSSRYWFRDGIPYPYHVEHYFDEYTLIKTLVGFRAGTGASAWPAAPVPVADQILRPSRLSPRPILVDDSDVNHPFRLSEAYAATLLHPDCRALGEYMAANPTAYMFGADMYRIVRDDGAEVDHWGFRVGLPDSGVAVNIREERRAPTAGGSAVPATISCIAVSAPMGGGTFQPAKPEYLPGRFPTAHQLIEAWAGLSGESPANATSWGFAFGCLNGCAGQPPVTVTAGVGVWRFLMPAASATTTSGAPQDTANRILNSATFQNAENWEGHFAVFVPSADDSEEFRLSHWASGARSTYDSKYKPESEPRVLAAEIQPQAVAESDQRLVWESGVAKVAWYITVLGALVGVVYYVAPLLRVGAVALFARISPADVPDHPQRRRILHLITEQPGIHLRALSRKTGLGAGVLRHHLGKLVDAHLVQASHSKGFTCFFPPRVRRTAHGGSPTSSVADRAPATRRGRLEPRNRTIGRRARTRRHARCCTSTCKDPREGRPPSPGPRR